MINFFGALVLAILTTAASCSFWNSCCNKNEEHHCQSQAHHTSEDTKKTDVVVEQSANILHVSNAQAFDDLLTKTNKPLIVKFEAEWCGACKEVSPLFHALSNEYTQDYQFIIVDASKVPSLRDYYNIRAVPTVIFIKNGKELAPKERIVGVFSREDFIDFIRLNTAQN